MPCAGRNFPTQVYFGDTHLHTAAWADPDFDPTEKAFYYVHVLEIPTPRWTTYDAKVFGVEIPEGAPTSIQERAVRPEPAGGAEIGPPGRGPTIPHRGA